MRFKTISFYKYIEINSPEILKEKIKEFCNKFYITGRILLGKEGINGACSGLSENIESFKNFLLENNHFSDLTFREQSTLNKTYHRLVIRIRKEIVHFGKKVNLSNKGSYITPKNLEKLYKENKDFLIIDARNNYEFKTGHFKNAKKLPIETFREFPKAIKKFENSKDKKVIMYCTGGIRCEKATAYMKEQGFKDVHHLKGGIIAYLNKFSENYNGGCFVFDDRLISKGRNTISKCKLCSKPSDIMINCHNIDCDGLFIACKKCQKKMNKSCSELCKNSKKRRKDIEILEPIGKVTHYYVKPSIALIKIENGHLELNDTIKIKGHTTNLRQKITDMRKYDKTPVKKAVNGELITIPVSSRVRKNDRILL